MKKVDLIKLSQDTFFDNNEGLISPDGHRKYNEAIIRAMGMDNDVQQLINPHIPKHAKPLVIDEVIKDEFAASWDRCNNHVIFTLVPTMFPIGEVVCKFVTTHQGIERFDSTFGPAVKFVDGKHYFEVVEPGRYNLLLKRNGPRRMEVYDVSEAEAAAGYKIYFDSITITPDGKGKDMRTYARLYFSKNAYQKRSYFLNGGKAYKYTTDFLRYTIPVLCVVDKGIAIVPVKAQEPVITRHGKNVLTPTVSRPQLFLRSAFSVKPNNIICLDNFLDPEQRYDMDAYYQVWYKKSKTWWYKLLGKRKTHKLVGYTKMANLPITELERLSHLGPGNAEFGFVPRFIDFQIRMKNAEKTVVAQYRATCIMNNNEEQKYLFRKK